MLLKTIVRETFGYKIQYAFRKPKTSGNICMTYKFQWFCSGIIIFPLPFKPYSTLLVYENNNTQYETE